MGERVFDIVVIGAGILGASIAFWLSEYLDARIAIIDREREPALHASSRNTGVIHRPFHLDPRRRRLSAWASNESYVFWKTFSRIYGLPWNQVGTLKVAVEDEDLSELDKYIRWGEENGMDRREMELLGSEEVSRIEPEVRCKGALLINSEASVDYGAYAKKLVELSISNGARFLGSSRVIRVSETDGVEIQIASGDRVYSVRSKLMINAAGGESLDLAKQIGLGREYSVLYFRGDYWRVDPSSGLRIRRNIYSVPRHKGFPFLDPHYIVRHNWQSDVGPNAVPVLSPYAYRGLATSPRDIRLFLFRKPITPKLRLLYSREFLSLAIAEWRSSISKRAMAYRVARFIPRLKPSMLIERIPGGIRSQVIGSEGLVSDPIVLMGGRSIHIANYNSPGATGAPAFSAYIYRLAEEKGYLEGFRRRTPRHGDLVRLLNWDEIPL
ncbi:MAG: FAD-dependent oxidoreductase [Sulfolobales archaeon]